MIQRLVIFDLDNTLVDRARFFGEWVETLIAVRHLDPKLARTVLVEEDDDGRAPRSRFFDNVRLRLDLADSAEALTEAYWRDQLARYRCDEPGLQALERLRELGYRLGIATNGGRRQLDKIHAYRLDTLVDAVCLSDAVGASKPDPLIFRAVAAGCRAPLANAWVVGDRPETDIAGAVAAGLRSVWVARGKNWPELDFRPTHVAQTLCDAVDLIVSVDAKERV